MLLSCTIKTTLNQIKLTHCKQHSKLPYQPDIAPQLCPWTLPPDPGARAPALAMCPLHTLGAAPAVSNLAPLLYKASVGKQ